MTGGALDLNVLLGEPPGSVVQVKGNHLSAQVGGKVFAYTLNNDLVLKLPGERVDALAESGSGSRLVMGKRSMKEWAAVPLSSATEEELRPLVAEAAGFVAGGARP